MLKIPLLIQLFFSFIFALVLSRVPFNVKNIPARTLKLLTLGGGAAKCCLLLTMHCTPQKSEMYLNVLNLWLSQSNFCIFTVDSANFPPLRQSNHPRWKALSFDQGLDSLACYSKLEFSAIARAERYFDWKNYDLVIKLTGKYFLPGLEDAVSLIPSGAKLVVQKRHNFLVKYQNSELYAFSIGYGEALMEQFNVKGAEQTLYDFSRKSKHCFRFPSLEITTEYARGDGSILKTL